MPFTSEQLENFHHFAQVRLQAVPAESHEELVDLWRLEHPDAEEQAARHHAIRQGLTDAAPHAKIHCGGRTIRC